MSTVITLNPLCRFTILGRAQQRGSKQASLIPKHGGGFVEKNGRPVVAARDMNPKSKAWMQEVRSAAAEVYSGDLITDPIQLSVTFYFSRPKAHYGSGRNADRLKPSAPLVHAQSPDLAKLIRSLEDALTGVIWKDDRQVFRYKDCSREWTTRAERTEVSLWTASGFAP